MGCYQCNRPALYQVGDQNIPLCLDCYHKLSEIQALEFLKSAAMMNVASQDLHNRMPFGPPPSMIPVGEIARAMQKSHTFNNIRVENSQVGVINTGNLARIDAAVTMTRGSDAELIGECIKRLTQGVLEEQTLDPTKKAEIIELVEALSDQVVRGRKKSVMSSILQSIRDRTSDVAGIAKSARDLYEEIKPLLD